MQYTNLGNSGLIVSRVSLGSWLTLGNAVDQSSSDRIVAHAIELGINLLDTADVYALGDGERALAAAIQGRRREHLVIASKCFFPMSDDVNDRSLSRKHICESIEQSLQRLGTDYLDLYQCHRPDPGTPLRETVMAMDDLIRQGKLLYWGVSMWPGELIAAAVDLAHANGWHPPISNQPLYNLFDRDIEREVIPASKKAGVGQIVYSPLAQGVLTGKYAVDGQPAADTRAANESVNQFISRYLTNERLQQAAEFKALAERHGTTATRLALAWCLRDPNVCSVIVGASREDQLTENAGALDVELPPELTAELEAHFPAPGA